MLHWGHSEKRSSPVVAVVVELTEQVCAVVDVAGAVVLAWGPRQFDASRIVFVDDGRLELREAAVCEEETHVNDHLGCIGSRKVFGHARGVG